MSKRTDAATLEQLTGRIPQIPRSRGSGVRQGYVPRCRGPWRTATSCLWGQAGLKHRRSDGAVLGGHVAVLQGQPQSGRVHAIQLLHELDRLWGEALQGVSHAGGSAYFEASPCGDEQAALPSYRELGVARRQSVQGNLEVFSTLACKFFTSTVRR